MLNIEQLPKESKKVSTFLEQLLHLILASEGEKDEENTHRGEPLSTCSATIACLMVLEIHSGKILRALPLRPQSTVENVPTLLESRRTTKSIFNTVSRPLLQWNEVFELSSEWSNSILPEGNENEICTMGERGESTDPTHKGNIANRGSISESLG